MENEQVAERLEHLEPTVVKEEAYAERMIEEIKTLESLLSPKAQKLISHLRPTVVADNVYDQMEEVATFGERLADRIASIAGSWGFIGSFVLLMIIWITVNMLLGTQAFDTYPFILLNLGLSTLAALQAPVILMSQNRQASKDRAVAQNDYRVNLKSELEIADLHRKIDMLHYIINQQHQLTGRLMETLSNESAVSGLDNNKQ